MIEKSTSRRDIKFATEMLHPLAPLKKMAIIEKMQRGQTRVEEEKR
jgi:hypothetical protein